MSDIPKPGVTDCDVPEYQSRSIKFSGIFQARAVRISSEHQTAQDPSSLHTTTAKYRTVFYGK
jgi:hypothetical protein